MLPSWFIEAAHAEERIPRSDRSTRLAQIRRRLDAGNQSAPFPCQSAKVTFDLKAVPELVSLIARGETPMARAMAFCDMPIGLR